MTLTHKVWRDWSGTIGFATYWRAMTRRWWKDKSRTDDENQSECKDLHQRESREGLSSRSIRAGELLASRENHHVVKQVGRKEKDRRVGCFPSSKGLFHGLRFLGDKLLTQQQRDLESDGMDLDH